MNYSAPFWKNNNIFKRPNFKSNESIPNKNNNTACINCGKCGHYSYQCSNPIVSYGMIVYRVNPKTKLREYIMICRKDSFGYVDFVRGKYTLSDIKHIQDIFREMSNDEHAKIKNAENFNELWLDLWNIHFIKKTHNQEERISQKKYETLKSGITTIDNQIISLDTIIKHSTSFKTPEWEFPKGRKELAETELDCALREFQEETGIHQKHVRVLNNVLGFDENYVGTNYIAYKHRYFLAEYINAEDTSFNKFQKNEVSKLEWKTFSQCLDDIRPYHLEKKQILTNIDKLLETYLII